MGVHSVSLIQYHVRRDDVTGSPLFFSLTNVPVSDNYGNLNTSYYPLYLDKTNDPKFLNIPIQINAPDVKWNDYKQIVVDVRDLSGGVPDFDEIYFLFQCSVDKRAENYTVNKEFYEAYGNALAQN